MPRDTLTIAAAGIALEIGARGGVWLNRIFDVRAQREWLAAPGALFAFKIHGRWYQSHADLVVDEFADGFVRAHSSALPVTFELTFSLAGQGDAVIVALTVTNQSQATLTVALAAPQIRGLVPPRDATGFVGCVPQEVGGVAELAPRRSHLEATASGDGGLQVAVIRSDSRLVYSKGIAGRAWDEHVDGNVMADAHRAIPRSPFAAVRRNDVQFDTFFVDRFGSLMTAWRPNPSATSDQVALLKAGFAEPGASLAVVRRNDADLDLYVIDRDHKLWRFFERNNGAWDSQPMPQPASALLSGAPLAAVRHGADLVDVFFADGQGDLWVAHQWGWIAAGAPAWQLQIITQPGRSRVPAHGHLRAVVHPSGQRVDVFFVGSDGGFYSSTSVGAGEFSAPVLRSAATGFAVPGTTIAATWRNAIQLDTFVIRDNEVVTLYAVDDSWRTWSMDLPPEMPRFVAEGAGLAAHTRSAGADTQLDLFVVAEDGKVWSNFVIGGGAWARWFPVFEAFVPLGMPIDTLRDLPGSMNSLEVASVSDRQRGGGVFVADLEGDVDRDRAPLQFCLSAAELRGSWRADVGGNASVAMPRFAIGVHATGDWRAAIDFVRALRPPASASAPGWLREAGAIYAASGGGYGAIYLDPAYRAEDLRDRLAGLFAWPGASFRSLPYLLRQAQDLGTSVLYLADYWEPATSAPAPQYSDAERSPYWNKGDYRPREDLGGEAAFMEGISAVHSAGGRVILYVEPFILFDRSLVIQARPELDLDEKDGTHHFEPGFDADHDRDFAPYGPHYRCLPPFYLPWQDYVVGVCERLVGRYGADGIFLDSWAWQMNIAVCLRGRGARGVRFTCFSMADWNRGVLALTRRVRAAIRRIKSDAVVMGETTAGPIARTWDGGLSTDLTLSPRDANRERIAASPVRYYDSRMSWFTNGRTINELYQAFAAGHNLALAGGASADQVEFVYAHRDIVRRLVELRRELKDALVYGRLVDLPSTGGTQLVAYLYSGLFNLVLAVVNVSDQAYMGAAKSDWFARYPVWSDALDAAKPPVTAVPDLLLYVPALGIRVFRASHDWRPIITATR